MTTDSTNSVNEFQDGPPSGSSSPGALQPWWRAPERILAVAATVGLRWFDKLDQEWTGAVLLAALGAPLAKWMLASFQQRRLKGGK